MFIYIYVLCLYIYMFYVYNFEGIIYFKMCKKGVFLLGAQLLLYIIKCLNFFFVKIILFSETVTNNYFSFSEAMPTKFHGPKRTKNVAPLSRAELHIHFDGAVRISTIWELCKQKGLPLPGFN